MVLDADVAADDLAQLIFLESQLRGFLHWAEVGDRDYAEAQRHIKEVGLPLNAEVAVWHHQAFYLNADVLFTSDRGGDQLSGAALRALRDLGYPEQIAKLEQALAVVATTTGHSLAQAIRRFRSDMLVHTNFRMSEHGSAMAFLGWGRTDERLLKALQGLVTDVKDVLEFLAEAKRGRIRALDQDGLEHLMARTTMSGALERATEVRNASRTQARATSGRANPEAPPSS